MTNGDDDRGDRGRYPQGRGYGQDYMRGGEAPRGYGYGYDERDAYARRRGELAEPQLRLGEQPAAERDTYAFEAAMRGQGAALGGAFGSATAGARGGRPSYAGRGPRNYRRSDGRIREDVCEALTRHPAIDASDVEVHVEQSEVTLSGTVDDRHARRLAEDVALSVSGVVDVQNRLRLRGGAQGGEREIRREVAREGSAPPEPDAVR